jgi:hypothetical protein
LNGSTGALDTTFNTASGFNNTDVYAICVDNSGNLYAAGNFTSYKGSDRQRIAKLNGSTGALDTTFLPGVGFDSVVRTLAIDSAGNVYAAGDFTGYKGINAGYIAKLNGANANHITTFNAHFGSSVSTITLDGLGNLYAGGGFNTYKTTNTRSRIAKIKCADGAVDTTFDSTNALQSTVRAICVDNSDSTNLYVGGDFTTYKNSNGRITCQNIVKILKSTGEVDTAFDTASGFDSVVRKLAIDSAGNVYAGGDFNSYKGTNRQKIAKLNGSTGALDTAFDTASGFDSVVRTLAIDSAGDVYVGGDFTTYKTTNTRQRIAKLNGSTGALDTTFNTASGFTDSVYAIVLNSAGDVYASGTFITYKGTSRQRIAKLNGSTGAVDTTFNSSNGFNSYVVALAIDSAGDIYAGGDFTSYGTVSSGTTTRQRLAKLNGSTGVATTFNNSTSGINNTVWSVAVDSADNIYAGGIFSTYTGTSRNRLVKMNSLGNIDTTFNTLAGFSNGIVYVLGLDSSQNLYAAGSFNEYKYSTSHSGAVTLKTTDSEIVTYGAISNSAPTNIELSSSSVAENTQGTVIIGNFSSTDPQNNVSSYALVAGAGDTHNSLFEIINDSNVWKLRTNASFDYENMPTGAVGKTLSIRVQATDAGGLAYSKAFTINVTNVNEAPSGITLSANSITEGNAVGAVIGTLSAIDPDTGDTPTLSVQAGADKFEIVGNQLRAKIAFDYETATSHSVTIRATDAGGLTRDEVFTINIINEATDDPVDAAAAVSGTGNKVYIRSAKNPKAVPHRFNNAPIVEGSVVVYPNNSQQKYYKLAGGELELYQIPITVPTEWGWDEASEAAWAVLQSFN